MSSADVTDALVKISVALLNVTLVQACGYVLKANGTISSEILGGIGGFGGLVCLPALLFKAVATLDFGSVPLELICALAVGKLLLILLCVFLGKITAKGEPGSVELAGGLFALMTTNSDDLGLGLPVMSAIFPPNIVQFCFVLAALQTGVFNPLIFILLGVGAAGRDAPTDGTPQASTGAVVAQVLRGLTKNSIVVSICMGLVYNLLFGALRGATLPFFLLNLTTTLGAAFGPIVLFLAGAANVGAFGKLAVLDSALMPLLTVLLKSLVLPTFVMSVVSWMGGERDTVDFAFAFASLPAAGSTLVFARPYRPSEAQTTLMNASLALGKLLGFPLLFVSAAIFKTSDVHDILKIEGMVASCLQAAALSGLLLLLLSATWHAPWHRPPLQTVFLLVALTAGYASAHLAASCVLHHGFLPDSMLFGLVSFFRWSADAAVIVAAQRRYHEAKARIDCVRSALDSAAPPLSSSPPKLTRGISLLEAPLLTASAGVASSAGLATASTTMQCVRLGACVGFGCAMTLPWALTLPVAPPSAELAAAQQVHLPLWVPCTSSSQAIVYALVYALLVALLLYYTGTVLGFNEQVSRALEGSSPFLHDGARCQRHVRLKAAHAFYVRFECFLFLTATRLALAAALCAQLAVSDTLSGSMGEMLLVHSLLGNASGFALFLLFGVGDGLFARPLALFAACWPQLLAEQSFSDDRAAIAEIKEKVASVAAVTGYGEASLRSRASMRRYKAALTIQSVLSPLQRSALRPSRKP